MNYNEKLQDLFSQEHNKINSFAIIVFDTKFIDTSSIWQFSIPTEDKRTVSKNKSTNYKQ